MSDIYLTKKLGYVNLVVPIMGNIREIDNENDN